MILSKFIEKLFKKSTRLPDAIFNEVQELQSSLLKKARLNATIDPRRRSGNLYNSISAGRVKVGKKSRIILQAGDQKVNYAGYVEFGTSRMYPRLYLTKAFAEVERETPKRLSRFISTYMRIK